MKLHPPVFIFEENTVGQDRMDMNVQIQRRTEALNKGDGTAQGRKRMPCLLAQRRCQLNRARRNSRSMRLISLGRHARRNRKRFGRVKTHCRTGTEGNTLSRRWAAESAMRLAQQDGHTPRFCNEKATRISSRHDGQRTRAKPWRRMPQRK